MTEPGKPERLSSAPSSPHSSATQSHRPEAPKTEVRGARPRPTLTHGARSRMISRALASYTWTHGSCTWNPIVDDNANTPKRLPSGGIGGRMRKETPIETHRMKTWGGLVTLCSMVSFGCRQGPAKRGRGNAGPDASSLPARPAKSEPERRTPATPQAKMADPVARHGHAMAYDARRGRVVLFGGIGRGGDLDDTWEWDGATWTQLRPVTSPRQMSELGMVYDARRGRVALFAHTLWEWDGTSWTHRAPGLGPPAPAGR
jgi:hypothetical protein